jgi:hypothetical protein
MKKLGLMLCVVLFSFAAKAQSDEAQQLLLNWEKLTQFKKILKNMYDGYKVLYKGYTAVKDISKGNFDLHKTFLDGLLQVSPVVQKYKRIADIINYQLRLTKEYKEAFNYFKVEKQFTTGEIDYIGKVYKNLFKQSVKSLEELTMIVTSGKLRMSDDERLQAIDRIYETVVDQYAFLNEFNNGTSLLVMQRKAEIAEIKMSRILNGIK